MNEQEEQREDRPESCGSEAAHERAGIVVSELFHDAEDDREPFVALLGAVDLSGKTLDSVHGCILPSLRSGYSSC